MPKITFLASNRPKPAKPNKVFIVIPKWQDFCLSVCHTPRLRRMVEHINLSSRPNSLNSIFPCQTYLQRSDSGHLEHRCI